MKKAIAVLITGIALLAGCTDSARVASHNLSKAASNFEVARRISVVNGITDKVAMVMEGFCSLEKSSTPGRMAVVCKNEDGTLIKNFLDKSDNTFVLTEQLVGVNVSTFHYRVFFRPQSLIRDIDFQGDARQLKKAVTPD